MDVHCGLQTKGITVTTSVIRATLLNETDRLQSNIQRDDLLQAKHNLPVSVATGDSKDNLGGACSARITLKEVGVPLTGMGLAAATDWEPATGMGAVSPAPVSLVVSKGDYTLSKAYNSVTRSQQR